MFANRTVSLFIKVKNAEEKPGDKRIERFSHLIFMMILNAIKKLLNNQIFDLEKSALQLFC